MALRSAVRSVLSSPAPWRTNRLVSLPSPLLSRCSHVKAPLLAPPLPSSTSEVSKSEGRVAQTTNVVTSGVVTADTSNEWHVLDRKVNKYPMVRGFTAIGTGGDDFVQAMVVAIESVLQQPIPEGWVTQKVSSRGKYVSVNIGPIRVTSSEQVQAVYNAMRKDKRMKYFF